MTGNQSTAYCYVVVLILEPIREDMSPDPALMKESGFLMEDASEMSDVFHALPRESTSKVLSLFGRHNSKTCHLG